MQRIDLSHVVHDGLVTYPGLPAPRVRDHLSRAASEAHYAPGTRFQIGTVELLANTGTYVDAPFHRFEDGADLSELPLERLAHLPGVVVDAPDPAAGRATGPEAFAGVPVEGHAVLVRSGWSRRFGTPAYGVGHPFLTEAAAELLVRRGALLVGVDSLNVDDTGDPRRPVHTALLRAGIPVLEHLTNLHALPPRGFHLHAVPVKVRGMGSFPVRAYALVEGAPRSGTRRG